MSQFVRTVLQIPTATGVAKDTVQWVHHWRGTVGDETNVEVAVNAAARIQSFLNDMAPRMASYCSWGTQWNLTCYDMADPEPRVPFTELGVTHAAPSSSGFDMPPEVAIVVTLEGDFESGTPKKRRRGRTYFGPLQTSQSDGYIIETTNVDAIANSFWDRFITTVGDARLCVHSRATAMDAPIGGPYDDDYVPELIPGSFFPVTRIFVDNAWDTQRRRGRSSSYRKGLS